MIKLKDLLFEKDCNPRRRNPGESEAQYRKRCGPRPLGQIKMGEKKNPRIPRKKGQPAGSKKHSDLYTDENPKGTIKGLKFATVKDAKASVSKINNSGKKHAHKIQAAVAMEQRAREMGKTSQANVYRAYINKMKKKYGFKVEYERGTWWVFMPQYAEDHAWDIEHYLRDEHGCYSIGEVAARFEEMEEFMKLYFEED